MSRSRSASAAESATPRAGRSRRLPPASARASRSSASGRSRARFCSSVTTARPLFASSAAVGSSARTSFGRLTSARATATRCRCPPESCRRLVVEPRLLRFAVEVAFAEEQVLRAGRGRRRPGRAAVSLQPLRHADVLHRGERVEEVVPLEDEPDQPADVDQFRLRSCRAACGSRRGRRPRPRSRLPASVRSPPMSVSSVVLPEPDGPLMMTSSPGITSSVLSNSTCVRVSPVAEVVVHSGDAEHGLSRAAGARV